MIAEVPDQPRALLDIVGDAFEAFGLELPYINDVRAAYAMVQFAEGLHGELGRIIEADYASRRKPEAA